MTIPRRQSEIVKLARSLGRVTVDDLARRFEVSAQTIRKDLNDLCERRALSRVHEGLLVITNNLNVAMQLYPHPLIEVIVAGGTVRRADGAVVGEASNRLIQQFKVDYAVVGASAIDEEGALLDFDYREVQAAQAIIANARNVILVADSTKFQRTAPVRIGHIRQVQTFVTDRGLPAGLRRIAQECGVAVIEAMDKAAHPSEGPTRDYPQAAS